MFKILTFDQISLKGLDSFRREHYEVAREIGHPDAILVRSHLLDIEDIAPTVKAIARAGTGVNNIPKEACTAKGIPVFNTPGANANAVKELVMLALLLGARQVIEGIQFIKELQTEDPEEMLRTVEMQKKFFSGEELAGKVLGVAGLGAIGSAVAEMALSIKMTVLGYDPGLSVDDAWRLSKEIKKVESLSALVSQSDYITLHLPATDSTHSLINREILAVFKNGSQLLNFARQAVVDTDAVVEALERGQLKKYISDFPHPSLVNRKDAILIPHLGASTNEAEENCAIMAAEQLIDFLENGNIRNSVNFPTLSLDRVGGYRIAFSNRNVPKMLSQVLSILADCNLNVIDMINKSLGEIAYNIIDLESLPPPGCLRHIEEIDGVIAMRLL